MSNSTLLTHCANWFILILMNIVKLSSLFKGRLNRHLLRSSAVALFVLFWGNAFAVPVISYDSNSGGKTRCKVQCQNAANGMPEGQVYQSSSCANLGQCVALAGMVCPNGFIVLEFGYLEVSKGEFSK